MTENFIVLSSPHLPKVVPKIPVFSLVKNTVSSSFFPDVSHFQGCEALQLKFLSVFRHSNDRLCALCPLPKECSINCVFSLEWSSRQALVPCSWCLYTRYGCNLTDTTPGYCQVTNLELVRHMLQAPSQSQGGVALWLTGQLQNVKHLQG